MDYKHLIVRGISYSQTQSGAYTLLLEEEETAIKLPIVIGIYEAQSISLGLEDGIKTPRPLTHDLFANFISLTSFQMVKVVIYKLVEGVFYSNIYFKNRETGEEIILDARTSDAVAMAVRFKIPIYTTSQIIEEAGVFLDLEINASEDELPQKPNRSLSNLSLEDLKHLLEQAVEEEDFDMALELQEEMSKRNKKID